MSSYLPFPSRSYRLARLPGRMPKGADEGDMP